MSHGMKKKTSSRRPRISKKREPSPYVSKIIKRPSKQRLEDALRHAVSHSDLDALEDYDEWLG